MRKSISEFIKSCKYCQVHKPNNHPNVAPIKTFSTPSGPFQKIGFDLIGPLKITDQGSIYIMTAIDFFSKMCYAEPLKSKDSFHLLENFKKILFRNPYFPSAVIMDNAPEFSEIKRFLDQLNITVSLAPPRHPQTNGAVENFNRSLKTRLRACTENLINWDEKIYQVIHEINSSIHSVTKMCPFTIHTGILNPHASFDLSLRNYEDKINVDFSDIRKRLDEEKSARCKKFENLKYQEYSVGQKVLVRNFRSKYPPFIGPFEIIEKTMTVYTLKEIGHLGNRIHRRHANDIKLFIELKIETEIDKPKESEISSQEVVKEPEKNQFPLPFRIADHIFLI